MITAGEGFAAFAVERLDEEDHQVGVRYAAAAKAHRAIYDLHRPTPMICPVCIKTGSGGRLMAMAPCPTLRALAVMWSSHPGYDRKWAPGA